MGSSMIPIVYIFIVLVTAYVAVGFFKVPSIDIIIISLSIIVLSLTMIKGHFWQKPVEEHFTTEIDNLQPINLEEDITPISSQLVVYNTAFNAKSFDEKGNVWLNIAAKKSDGTCDTTASNAMFNFELQPIYSRRTGFYFGNNRLIGPYSNALNIQFHNTFTVVVACKHGNLLVDDTNKEIELFKFYANSPNNNGLSMYIQKDSLKNINNIQMGKLMFQYSNRDALQCKLRPDYELISFEKDILTFYFIIKETDHIRICVMNEKNTNIEEILRLNVENADVTFSNKEVVLNRLKNWNGNVYTLAMYNVALSDDDITGVYSHIVGEYMKYVNPNFISMIKQYNDTLAMLQKFLTCPYDKKTCDSCSTIDKWNDVSQLLSASSQCRNAINDFCMGNTTHPLCKCWNTENAAYKSDSCRMFRGIFTNKNAFLDGLSQSDIDYIMNKYGLIHPEDCPKPITKPEFLKNTYNAYEFDKLKIKLDDVSNVGTVMKLYPQDTDYVDDNYKWNKIKTQFDEDKTKKYDETKDTKVQNFYRVDPEMNYKNQNQPQIVKEFDKIKQYSDAERKKLNDTSDLNIIPDTTKIDAPSNKETKSSTQATDSFFSRFMKVNNPDSEAKTVKEDKIQNYFKNDPEMNYSPK